METIAERLDIYRRSKGLTYSSLASSLGLTEGAIRNAIKRDKVKLSHINVISDTYDVSKNWLLTGEGEMLKDNSEPKEKKSIILADNKEVIQLQKEKADLEKLSSKKDKEIEFLRANIDKLVDLVNKQTDQINKLTDPLNKK